jgi:hypothetical protein
LRSQHLGDRLLGRRDLTRLFDHRGPQIDGLITSS